MEGGGGEEVLLKKIEELEAGQAILKQQIQIHTMSHSHCSGRGDGRKVRSHSLSPRRPRPPRGPTATASSSTALSDRHCLRVLHSMPHSVHILDLHATIIFWNHSAHLLYGYSASEALGSHAIHLLFHSSHHHFASLIFHRVTTAGHTWAGNLPVQHKSGHKFLAFSTNTPFYDDDGSLLGMVCVSTDPTLFQFDASLLGGETCSNTAQPEPNAEAASTPLQAAIASKLTTLVSLHINSTVPH